VKLPDVNLFLYAYDSRSARHAVARDWLEQTLSGTETVALTWTVLLAFIRLSTRPAAMASEAELLRAQIDRYEQLRDGHITGREIDSLKDLPAALIEARIAARLTQHQLAQRVSVAEQQIQRWEANAYSGVNLDRLQNVADALGVSIHETITYSSAA
jgi:predicted nucleic acid-binding protein